MKVPFTGTMGLPQKIHPIALYLVTLAGTIAAYSLYALIAVPWIEGPPTVMIQAGPESPSFVPPDLKAGFANLFGPDEWEMGSTKTVQIRQGKILCLDYQPHDDGYIEVRPFTLILEPEQGEEPPTVIQCKQKARIWMDGPLEFGGGEAEGGQRIEKVELLGQVRISRARSLPDRDDGIELVTSNVQIETDHLHTLEGVDFRFGPHSGQGSHLRLEWWPAEGVNRITQDFGDIRGVRQIRLKRLNFLRLEPAALERLSDPASPSSSAERATVEVTCRGELVVALDENEARLAEAVQVRELREQGDSLACDQLRLRFRPSAEVAPRDGVPSQWELSGVIAEGTPAVLNAPSRESRVTGERLEYDLQTGSVVADDRVGQVMVQQRDLEFRARHVRYVTRPDGSLGDLDADGPGTLIRRAALPAERFSASWQDRLEIRTEDRLKRIQMAGDAQIRLQEEYGFDAGEFTFWLWPVRIAGEGDAESRWDYLPSRLVAQGEVRLDSSDWGGTARRLTATWPEVAATTAAIPSRHTVRRPARQEAGFPIPPGPTRNGGEGLPAANKAWQPVPDAARKFLFDGDFVTVDFADHTSQPEVTRLEIDGNVSVIEAPRKGEDPPLKIKGSKLQMAPQGEKLYRVFVGGNSKQAAEVETASLRLAGNEIFLDQVANKLWVNGAGRLAMQPGAEEERAGNMEVTWLGRMIFDGRNIYFERDVRLDSTETVKATGNPPVLSGSPEAAGGETRRTRARSGLINVTLKKPILFRDLEGENRGREKAEVAEVVLFHVAPGASEGEAPAGGTDADGRESAIPVVIEMQTLSAAGELQQQMRLVAPEARIRPGTQELNARGPGLVSTHRLSSGGAPNFARNLSDGTTLAKAPLSFLRVNFDGTLAANADESGMTVVGNVRGLFLPTNRWDESTDPDQLEKIPTGAAKLVCDEIRIDRWQPRGVATVTTEFVATGNTHLWGDLFEATAHQIRYDDQREVLVMEGSNRSDAILWYQTDPRTQRSRLAAGKLSYRPSDQRYDMERIRSLSTEIGRQPGDRPR